MVKRRRNRGLECQSALKLNWNGSACLAGLALAGASIATQAASPSPSAGYAVNESALQLKSSEADTLIQARADHVIQLDNSKGTTKLELRENLRQRQCVATVKPEFLTVAPGEIGEVRMDVRDDLLSGCQGESKHVLWNVTATEHNERTLSYMVLFSVEPKKETLGRMRITSNKSSRPGTPSAANCGDYACLDEWVPLSRKESTVSFY